MIFLPSYMIFPLLFLKRLAAKVGRSFLFSFDHKGISDQLVDTSYLHPGNPIFQEGRKGCLVNGTDQERSPVLSWTY
jgi:hypothetical protein